MKRYFRSSVWCLWLVSLVVASWPPAVRAYENKTLISGWSAYPPYSYIENVGGIPQWRGLDVELLRDIAKRAGYFVDAPDVDWVELVHGIETGERDIAAQATRTPEREEFATFSVPYRTETMVLIVPRGKSASLPARTVSELVDRIKQKKFRLGVGPGIAYPSEEVRTFLANPANSDQVVAINDRHLLQNLIEGRIDGYLADRMVAADMIKAHGAEGVVEEHPVMVEGPLHLMFSKASVPPQVVADFNRAIENIQADGTYSQLNEKYTFPILVRLTLKSEWFTIVDLVGTAAFAFSGLLLAFRFKYDIFGALVLASLPAVGGGVVRDVITNRETLAVLSSPIYLEIVAVLVVGGFGVIRLAIAVRESAFGVAAAGLLERRSKHVQFLIQVFDAIGLAAFTVTGVVVGLATQSEPLLLWGPILAAITAAGGGILRDVVRSDPNVPFIKGELYPEIALVWGAILSGYMIWQTRQLNADEIALGIVVTFLGAFLTRIAVIHFGIRSPRMSV